MFKLIVLISLGASWIGLCIEGTGTVVGDSQVTKNVVIEPIDTVHEGTPGDEVKRAKRGENEPTLALLLTYHGNNCHKKQKASTSKYETIHITNGGSAKNLPANNLVGKKLLESIVHTTSHSSSSGGGGGDSTHKNQGDHAVQHKYQELLDQLNNHAGNEKCGCCGLNVGACKNLNQQYVQLADNLRPIRSTEKHTSILESVGSDSLDASDDNHHNDHHHHHHEHHAHPHQHHDDNDSDDDDSGSYSHDDESNPVSFSISGESDESGESFEISDEHSASDEHDIGPVEHSLIPNTHDNYRVEYHPRETKTRTIIPKPVKLRPKFSSKPHADQIILTKSQKTQPRILAGPHIKLKSKHFPHRSHLKPLYIETESIYSDSMESDESQSHSEYFDEESLELPIETDNHGHNKYKSVITHTLQANTKNMKQINTNTSHRLSKLCKFGCQSCGFKKTKS